MTTSTVIDKCGRLECPLENLFENLEVESEKECLAKYESGELTQSQIFQEITFNGSPLRIPETVPVKAVLETYWDNKPSGDLERVYQLLKAQGVSESAHDTNYLIVATKASGKLEVTVEGYDPGY